MVVYRVQAEFGTTGLSPTARAMTVAHDYPTTHQRDLYENEVQNSNVEEQQEDCPLLLE